MPISPIDGAAMLAVPAQHCEKQTQGYMREIYGVELSHLPGSNPCLSRKLSF